MKACVVGMGAIGGWMAEALAQAGWSISALARGATLEALRRDGLIFRRRDEERRVAVTASHDPAEIEAPDYLIVAVKGQDLPALAPRLSPVLGARTTVVSALNGVPWWFLEGFGGPLEGRTLASVDPDGAVARTFGTGRTLGAVIHASAHIEAPGVIRLVGADRLTLGEPDGSDSERLRLLAEAFQAGGIRTVASPRIHDEVWSKLWGNMTMNPLSVLTESITSDMLADPGVRGLCIEMMREMQRIGGRLGLTLPMTPEERMEVTLKLGGFRTSMLQDWQTGRPLELDPILGVLVEMAQMLEEPAPFLSGVLGLVRARDRTRGQITQLSGRG